MYDAVAMCSAVVAVCKVSYAVSAGFSLVRYQAKVLYITTAALWALDLMNTDNKTFEVINLTFALCTGILPNLPRF